MGIPNTQPEDDQSDVLDAPTRTYKHGRSFSFRPNKSKNGYDEQARGAGPCIGDDMPYKSAASRREPDMGPSIRYRGPGMNPTLDEGYGQASIETGFSDRTQYQFTGEENRPIDVPEKKRPLDWEADMFPDIVGG